MRAAFPRRQYARRSLVETVFSTAKRKLSARAPGRSPLTQQGQALLLGLAYNLHRYRHSRRRVRTSTELPFLEMDAAEPTGD
jgi:hypothetical protein